MVRPAVYTLGLSEKFHSQSQEEKCWLLEYSFFRIYSIKNFRDLCQRVEVKFEKYIFVEVNFDFGDQILKLIL